MDILRYKEMKDAGLIELRKYGISYGLTARRFDPATGAELMPETQELSLSQLKEQAEQHVKAAEELSGLIADLEALG